MPKKPSPVLYAEVVLKKVPASRVLLKPDGTPDRFVADDGTLLSPKHLVFGSSDEELQKKLHTLLGLKP